jgi:Skp family chaperone for outer membrane proteins
MDINDEQQRKQWHDAIARLTAQIDSLRTRIDSESRMLYAKLSAEVAELQSDLRTLEITVLTTSSDVYTRQIAKQIEELRAKGDAAYNLLQASVATPIDTFDAEIRQLEAIAATTSGDAREKIMVRVEQLKSERATERLSQHTSDEQGRLGGTQP